MAHATLTRVLEDIKYLGAEELQAVERAIRARQPQLNDPDSSSPIIQEQIIAANAGLRETIVALPLAVGADNESIDADLARAYSDNNADIYQSGGITTDHHFEQEGFRKLLGNMAP